MRGHRRGDHHRRLVLRKGNRDLTRMQVKAGLAETRGNIADTFWTWRQTMYRFALDMTPEDIEAAWLSCCSWCGQVRAPDREASQQLLGGFAVEGCPFARGQACAHEFAALAVEFGAVGLVYRHLTFGFDEAVQAAFTKRLFYLK